MAIQRFDPARSFQPPQVSQAGTEAATQAQAANASALAAIYANTRRPPRSGPYDATPLYARAGESAAQGAMMGMERSMRNRERREDRAFTTERDEAARNFEVERDENRRKYEQRLALATQRLGDAHNRLSGEYQSRVARASQALIDLDTIGERMMAGELEGLPFAAPMGPQVEGALPWTKEQVMALVASAPELQGRITDELLDSLASGRDTATLAANAEVGGAAPVPAGDMRINSETAERLFKDSQILQAAVLATDNARALNDKQKARLVSEMQIMGETRSAQVAQEAQTIQALISGIDGDATPAKQYGRRGAATLLSQLVMEVATKDNATPLPPTSKLRPLLRAVLPDHMKQGEFGQAVLRFMSDPNNPENQQALSTGQRVGLYNGIHEVVRQMYTEIDSVQSKEAMEGITGVKLTPQQFASIKEQANAKITEFEALARNALVNQNWGAKAMVDNPQSVAAGVYPAIVDQLKKQGIANPSASDIAEVVNSGRALDMLFSDFADNGIAAGIIRGDRPTPAQVQSSIKSEEQRLQHEAPRVLEK